MSSIHNAATSLRALASYNQHRSSTARHNSSLPYPYYQDVYAHSIDPARDNGFPNSSFSPNNANVLLISMGTFAILDANFTFAKVTGSLTNKCKSGFCEPSQMEKEF